MSLFKYSTFQLYINEQVLNAIIVEERNSNQTLKWNGAWGPEEEKKKKKNILYSLQFCIGQILATKLVITLSYNLIQYH